MKRLTKEQMAYWRSLPKAVREVKIANAEAGSYGYGWDARRVRKEAILKAWDMSPRMVAEREARAKARRNRLVTCARTGKQVAWKDAVTIGDTSIAQSALSDAERAFLRL